MTRPPHAHLGATYRLIPGAGIDAFVVEVAVPGMAVTTITGFTRAGAERWVAKHREAVAVGRELRPSFRMPKPR